MLCRTACILVLTSLILMACKKDDEEPKCTTSSVEFDVELLLKKWSSSIIIPSYKSYKTSTRMLSESMSDFSNSPSEETLAEVKARYKLAYLSWQTISMYEFGPAEEITLRVETNTYPTDTSKINELIEQGIVDTKGADKLDAKGFPACDFLLNNTTASKVLLQFTDGVNAKNRMDYLKAVITSLDQNAISVYAKWSESGEDYSLQYNSAVGVDVGSSLGMSINAITQHLERFLRDGKFAIPNGNRSFSGLALPGHLEAYYEGDITVELALKNLTTIENFYLGKLVDNSNELGLDDYLNNLNAKYNEQSLDKAIQNQFEICKGKISSIPFPLKENLISNKDNIDEVVKELQKLIVLFKVDIPSATGILITYQDNDGD